MIAFLRGLSGSVMTVGLEAGPLSQWLHRHLTNDGFEVGLDDVGDERATTTIEILLPDTQMAGKKSAERTSKPHGFDERQGAVIAALRGLLAQAKDGAGAAFRAAQIRDHCDPGPFDKVRDTPDNFLKAVGRVLDRLSEMPDGPVIKREEGYLLTEENAG